MWYEFNWNREEKKSNSWLSSFLENPSNFESITRPAAFNTMSLQSHIKNPKQHNI